ncbi:MAG: hypothetical protein ACXAC8_02675 [Candidatus Hodarchaeales archaeon]|jgi:hypothetical protein
MVDSFSDVLLAPFAKYLSKYGEWKLSDMSASILIPSKEFHFNKILVRSKRLSYSADKSWEFVASLIIYDKTNFSPDSKPLYQRLKGYECEIARKGLIRKKFLFQSSPLLFHLQKEIFELRIDELLVNMLNQDEKVHQCISTIAPDRLSIKLFSQPIITKDVDEYCREFHKTYDNPSELIWNVSIEKFLGAIVSRKKYFLTLDKIIEGLEIISKSLLKITKLSEKAIDYLA